MKKIILTIVFAGIGIIGFSQTVKQDVKKTGKEIGHESKKLAKATARTARRDTRPIVKVVKRETPVVKKETMKAGRETKKKSKEDIQMNFIPYKKLLIETDLSAERVEQNLVAHLKYSNHLNFFSANTDPISGRKKGHHAF